MKSKLFSRFDKSPKSVEDFKEKVKKLTQLPLEVLERFPHDVIRIDQTRTPKDEEREVDEIAKKLNLEVADTYRAFQVSKFFMKQLLSTGVGSEDAPEDIVDDMEEIRLVEKESREKLVKFLTCMKKLVAEEVELDTRKRSTSHSTLPVLSGISTAVNYRPVFDKSFLTEKGAEEYQPKCKGVVAIATINISLDEGLVQDIYFQADRRELRMLIESLKAIEKEFEVADKYLNLKS